MLDISGTAYIVIATIVTFFTAKGAFAMLLPLPLLALVAMVPGAWAADTMAGFFLLASVLKNQTRWPYYAFPPVSGATLGSIAALGFWLAGALGVRPQNRAVIGTLMSVGVALALVALLVLMDNVITAPVRAKYPLPTRTVATPKPTTPTP